MAAPAKIGKYDIQGRLGEGGVAIVFQAYDPVIQRSVALKAITKSLLDPAERPFILERFQREARAAGRLVHPNIVAIFEYGEDDEFAYIAMEYVPGQSLDRYLAGTPRPELSWVRDFSIQLLDALEYSHARGVVHRDIKPSNILVAREGRIKITDFGIARIEASHLTATGEVLGTPNYMSPEQFLGQPSDQRSDVYSAATMIYEMLVGRRPFVGTTVDLMRQVVQVMPPPPSDFEVDLPPALEEALLKGLAKRPEERWQSAREFGESLERAFEQPSGLYTLHSGGGAAAGLSVLARKLGSQAAAPEQEPPSAGEGARPRVLFVDDEERIVTALKTLCRGAYHVFTATDGNQALDFVRRFPIHVIVTDQRMPGITGVEVLRQVRELSPDTVRILLTGYSDLAAIVGSINEGEVYRFISKPWNNEELQKTLADAAAIALALAQDRGLPAPIERSEASLLVVDGTQDLYRSSRELLASVCPVAYSPGPAGALRVMQEIEVAAIVADLDLAGEDMALFVEVLKQEHPEILTIAVTAASDSEAIIELINKAQIYRFLNKPVSLMLLKQHAVAALARYQAFKSAPVLVCQHQVQESPKAKDSSLAAVLRDGLRALSSRIAPGGGPR